MEIFLGENFPGRNCPVGIIWVAIFRVGVFLVPSTAEKLIHDKRLLCQTLKFVFLLECAVVID